MGSTKKLTSMVPVALLVAGIAAPGMANAADLLIDPPIVEVPEVVTHQAGGWYLRGDITYDFHSTDNPTYSAGNTELTFNTGDVDDAFDVGLGIGYQINENFRVDLTGEYLFSSDFVGSTSGTCGDSNAAGRVSWFTLVLQSTSPVGQPSNCWVTHMSISANSVV